MVSLDLDIIAAHLEGLEETLIHRFLDRAQFRRNAVAYEPNASGFRGAGSESLFHIRLRYQEHMDAEFGRFLVPEERPYHPQLPESRRAVNLAESPLRMPDYECVNLTPEIVAAYLPWLDTLCVAGDDGQYGSSVEHDVYAIQALSRRVHYGALYVAESKYRLAPAEFLSLISANDREALVRRLTRPEVERRVLSRVAEKAAYLQARINRTVRTAVAPEVVVGFFRATVIPLTKEGEVRYLLSRMLDD
jgi:chorismate mutase